MRKIFKNRKGFSLGELMVVVTIICILFGVVAVNVIQYRKKLRQLAYDSNAEIILEAAQNRLSELYAAYGEKAFDDVTTMKKMTVGDENLYYLATDESDPRNVSY